MDWRDILFVAVLLLIAVVTVIGNVLVILAVLSNRRLQNPANYLIVNLAISDFFQGALSLPIRTAGSLNTSNESLVPCDVVISLIILFHSAANFNLALIALDRFIAVSRPFSYANGVKTFGYKIVIGLTWLFCLILSGCIIVGWRKHPENAGKICRFGTTLTDEYLIMYVCIVDVTPLTIMMITYTYIFRATRRHISHIRAHEIAVNNAAINQAFDSRGQSDASACEQSQNDIGTQNAVVSTAVNANATEKDKATKSVNDTSLKHEEEEAEMSNNNNDGDELKQEEVPAQDTDGKVVAQLSVQQQTGPIQSEMSRVCESCNDNPKNGGGGLKKPRITSQNSTSSSSLPLSTSRTRKATRTVLAIMGFFIVLCLPITIIDVIDVWCKTCPIPQPVIIIALCMVGSNSAVNVFVYGGYNMDYRKAYWNIWRRLKQTFSSLFSRTKNTVQSVQAATNSSH